MSNIRYLTGFMGSEGTLFVGQKRVALLVDGRYITQAHSEVKDCELIEFKNKIKSIADILHDCRLQVIGFESSAVTFDSYLELKNLAEDITLKPLSKDMEGIRALKSKDEIELLRKAADISANALTNVLEKVKPGVSEKDIALLLDFEIRKQGGEGPSFDTIVASGNNSSMPHARPSDRKVKKGDFLTIDYGAIYEGYHSDETCTFAINHVDQRQLKVYDIVKNAHDRALDAVQAGVPSCEVDKAARDYIESKGFGCYFSHGTGHGVGLDVHEVPVISKGRDDCLEEGMIITVEPGIYIPGSWGIRIEDMALVGKDGCEILTKMSKDLRVL
jgi:Xaa-Pro aminopeptidase